MTTSTSDIPRVVIAHDYLTQRGGAERAVLSMLKAFPTARVVTSVYEPSQSYPEFAEHPIETSYLNRVPALRRDPRLALPLLARAWESLHIDDADVVLCSSTGWAHGVSTSARKVVYCHNPARWLYQPDDYLAGAPKAARMLLDAAAGPLIRWDQRKARSASRYLANSSTVQARIKGTYGLEAQLLHPPTSIDPAGPQQPVAGLTPGFVLTVGRPRGYKNTINVCRALAADPSQTLAVVGGLPEGEWGEHIVGLTDVTDAQLRWLYANCSALVAVSREDFGLTVIEANSFGAPVLAWRAHGYLDTVVEGVNGHFIDRPDPDYIRVGLRELLADPPARETVLTHADQFSEASFRRSIHGVVNEVAAA